MNVRKLLFRRVNGVRMQIATQESGGTIGTALLPQTWGHNYRHNSASTWSQL